MSRLVVKTKQFYSIEPGSLVGGEFELTIVCRFLNTLHLGSVL